MDFAYVRTWSGFCCTAFVMDLFSRRIVGWSTSTTMNTDMDADFVLGALEQAIWTRKNQQGTSLKGLVHHWDHASQYLSIRCTQRLIEKQIEASTTALRHPPQHDYTPFTKPGTIHPVTMPTPWMITQVQTTKPAPDQGRQDMEQIRRKDLLQIERAITMAD